MSIHPIVQLASRMPHLLIEHAKAYGDLLQEELRNTVKSLALHALLYIGSAALVVFGAMLGGVSMLIFATAPDDLRHGRLLVAVPAVPIVLSVVFFAVARCLPVRITLGVLDDQVKADIAMLHEAKLP